MKKQFLFTLAVLMICGCSDSGDEIDQQNPKEEPLNLVKPHYLLMAVKKSNPFMFIATVIGR